MTAQEQGLNILVQYARAIIPPQLDFLIIIYRPDGPIALTSVMHPSLVGKSEQDQYERSLEAAKAYISTPPREDFTARAQQRN